MQTEVICINFSDAGKVYISSRILWMLIKTGMLLISHTVYIVVLISILLLYLKKLNLQDTDTF